MTREDFTIGWRTLVQDPVYSLVVVLGLAIGFGTCLLLLGFVRYSWQYNAHVPHVEQVYVVKQRDNRQPTAPWFDQVPLLLHSTALKAPGVDSARIRPKAVTASRIVKTNLERNRIVCAATMKSGRGPIVSRKTTAAMTMAAPAASHQAERKGIALLLASASSALMRSSVLMSLPPKPALPESLGYGG